MDIFWHEITNGLADPAMIIRVVIRLLAAVILGGVIGFERERAGKAAGVRTHILVSLATCTFVVVCAAAPMTSDSISRVIQGIVTGIGFLGAGTILKLSDRQEIRGLTTSAGILMTAAIGVGCGLGVAGLALIATLIALALQIFIRRIEYSVDLKRALRDKEK
jgi:putative Mg2+ transporter-C (MgtC) family protein